MVARVEEGCHGYWDKRKKHCLCMKMSTQGEGGGDLLAYNASVFMQVHTPCVLHLYKVCVLLCRGNSCLLFGFELTAVTNNPRSENLRTLVKLVLELSSLLKDESKCERYYCIGLLVLWGECWVC